MNNEEKLSEGNAFTLGYGKKPHGYVRGAEAKATKMPPKHVKAGLGANGGTIYNMGKSNLRTRK